MWYRKLSSQCLVACLFALLTLGCSDSSTGGNDEVITDGIAPSIISDLAVSAFTNTTVTLNWTATGDDTTSGTASRYDIRCSASTITFGNFDSAFQIVDVPVPHVSGTMESMMVTGLSTDSTYYFAIKVFDEENNWQGVSNCVSATCIDDFTVTFTDAGLNAAIRSAIAKPTGDIRKSDLLQLHDLVASSRGISNLAGLQHCVRIETLDLHDNSIEDLDLLAGLTDLRELNLGNNLIDELTALGSLTSLEVLMTNDNDIADLSPASSLTALRVLGIHNNLVEDLYPLVANGGLTAGDSLYLDGNPLSFESINTHVPALRTRGVAVFFTADVTPPGRVINFAVDSVGADLVKLTWTAPGGDAYSGQAYAYDLRYSTDSATVAAWTDATAACGLPSPATSGTTQSVNVTGLQTDSTYYFGLRSADKSMNWSDVSNIVSATPYVDEPVVIPDGNLEAALRVALSIPSGDIHRSDLLDLTSFTATSKGITDLTGMENCANLSVLNLAGNSISSIEALGELTTLTQLQLQNNSISNIAPLSDLHGLAILQLTGNPIADLSPLSGLTGLWYLSVIGVNTSDMSPLSGLTYLNQLFVVGNNISDLSFVENMAFLTVLYASGNAISSLEPLEHLANLTTLDIQYNQVADILPLVNNSGLGSGDAIDLRNNPLSPQSLGTYIPQLQSRGVTVNY